MPKIDINTSSNLVFGFVETTVGSYEVSEEMVSRWRKLQKAIEVLQAELSKLVADREAVLQATTQAMKDAASEALIQEAFGKAS